MCYGTETKCPICGNTIVQTGKGRTKEYCSDACKGFFKFKNALERCVSDINFLHHENASMVKGEIFRMANQIVIRKDY